MATSSVESSTNVVFEANTQVAFPLVSEDGKKLSAVGVRKRSVLGLVSVKIYAFGKWDFLPETGIRHWKTGIYVDYKKLSEVLKLKIESVPEQPNQELYELAINGDVGMEVRLVLVFGGLNMRLVRKIFNDNLGASIRKLSGVKNDDLLQRVLGEARDDIKLSGGSVIDIAKLPGFILQTKVKGEVVSEVESELLCRAFFNMYLGEDPLDAQAKAKFGRFLVSMLDH